MYDCNILFLNSISLRQIMCILYFRFQNIYHSALIDYPACPKEGFPGDMIVKAQNLHLLCFQNNKKAIPVSS